MFERLKNWVDEKNRKSAQDVAEAQKRLAKAIEENQVARDRLSQLPDILAQDKRDRERALADVRRKIAESD